MGSAIRREIQALRAVSVSMVIVYHFWPSALPGGFVGVAVFIVISGYLITGHLVRRPPTSLCGFTEFWSRRVVRLIAAAAAAMLGTLVSWCSRSRAPAAPQTAVKVALLPVLAVMAWISTMHLENPLRRVRRGGSLRLRAVVCLPGTVAVLGTAFALHTLVVQRNDVVQARINASRQVSALSRASAPPRWRRALTAILTSPWPPPPEFARTDITISIQSGKCLNWPPFGDHISCIFGDLEEPVEKIAVLDNSHAG